jgi:hypothetical protein
MLHVASVCLTVLGLLWACRFVYRRSRLAGLMFTAGVLIRAFGGAFFVAVSYFGLPYMTRLQLGDGFWALAPDAQEYYRLASRWNGNWWATLTPGYVVPLALWMRALGVNPVSPVLFSLAGHAVAVVTLVAAFGRTQTRGAQQALHLLVAAFSFSPMLVFGAVFGLKDVFVAMLIVMVASAWGTLAGAAWRRATLRTDLLAVAAAAVAIWFLAAIRAYFAILLLAAMAVAYAGCVIGRRPSRLRATVQGAIVLPLFALVIAGADYGYPVFVAKVVTSVPEAVIERRAPMAQGGLEELDRRREAIDRSGGDSLITRPADTGAGNRVEGTGTAAGNRPKATGTSAAGRLERDDPSAGDRVKRFAIGLVTVFVPITVLQKLSIIDIHIRASARLVADADTLVLDVTAVMVLWLLIVNRSRINPDALTFAAALVVLVALPLGYVMTNYGTLIRLRLMVAAPIWLLTLALAPGLAARRAPSQAPRPDPAPTP